jgi:hypothetical protein
MIYYAIETEDGRLAFYDTIEEARLNGKVIYICDENHVCTLYENLKDI